MTTQRLLLISTWFQIVWFLAVVGREPWQLLTVSLVALTLLISVRSTHFKLARFLLLFAFGVFVDYLNLSLGLFSFESSSFPIWLGALWAIFLWYAYYLLPLLNRYPFGLVSMLCGVAGALSYFAGMKLGAVQFPIGAGATLAVLFAEWVLIINVINKGYGHESDPENDSRSVRQ